MRGKISQTTLRVFDELCHHSEQAALTVLHVSPGCVRSRTTRQGCVKLSVWCLQSMVFRLEHNVVLKADISPQSQNILCPIGKIHAPFPFRRSLMDSQ